MSEQTNLSEARAQLLALILEVSFERKKVTLASGRESNFYLDLRQTLMRPQGVALAGRLVLDLLVEARAKNDAPIKRFGVVFSENKPVDKYPMPVMWKSSEATGEWLRP